MASISISASRYRACSAHHITGKNQLSAKSVRSVGTTQANSVVNLDIEDQKTYKIAEQMDKHASHFEQPPKDANGESKQNLDTELSALKFSNERWKNGTWDLNMFAKDGKMDWDAVIVAESGRRKFLEVYPQSCTNEEPVMFRSSIIPWWAWLRRSYLPEAELLNGRAAMVGFFMSYVVDALTGLDVVGQTGNFICKTGLFLTVISVVLFMRTQDFKNLKDLANEATLYDKQWRASWQDPDDITGKNT